MNHMIETFEFLYPFVQPNGVYMIEDVSCSYSDRFDGGYRREGTIVEYTKDLIDRMHAISARDSGGHDPDSFTLSTHSINIYDGIIAFERRPKSQPQSITTGGYPRLGERPVLPSTLDVYRDRQREQNRRNRLKRRQGSRSVGESE